MDYDALIKRIAEQDMSALETLYRDLYTDVFAYLLSILRNAAAAQDLAQDTFLRVYKSAAGFHSRGQGRAWVLKIARNLALNH